MRCSKLKSTIVGLTTLCVILAVCCDSTGQATNEYDHIFPLIKGAYWIYQGPVESSGSAGSFRKSISWKMEVTDVIERQDIKAAVVKGFPDDLWWYTENKQPDDYLIVRFFPSRFYLLGQADVKTALDALRDNKNILQGLVKEPQLFLDFPLIEGKRFGETELVTRTDEFYSWVVRSKRQSRLDGVKGVSNTRIWTIYTVSQYTVGSHTEFEFVNGVGIIKYLGHHNGTVSDFDMKLVEFHPGKK